MTIAFISDLHLEENNPYIADIFKQFLQDCITNTTALYILGDFFEVWIGDDDLTSFNRMIIAELKKATQQGLPIYVMHGNRDFLLGKKFARRTGCQLLPDEFVVNLGGKPTLLMHGDTLCTEDTAYLKFRKKSRGRLFKVVVSCYPLEKRRAMAQRYRTASKEHTSKLPDYIMDVTQTEVERVMQKNQVFHMIHGHTHRPAQHLFQLNGQPATRTVLAAWHEYGSALLCDDDGRQRIIELR